MEEANNPVGKLLRFMEKGLEVPGGAVTLDAWASILECTADDSRSLVRGLAMLMDLCDSAKAAIEEFVPGDKTLFLPWTCPYKTGHQLPVNLMPRPSA